ncbi:MAG: hypothetical protein LBQ88_07025, partial [Treponema sp.]|nr:hypothetical protein [Treponema sp.]
ALIDSSLLILSLHAELDTIGYKPLEMGSFHNRDIFFPLTSYLLLILHVVFPPGSYRPMRYRDCFSEGKKVL